MSYYPLQDPVTLKSTIDGKVFYYENIFEFFKMYRETKDLGWTLQNLGDDPREPYFDRYGFQRWTVPGLFQLLDIYNEPISPFFVRNLYTENYCKPNRWVKSIENAPYFRAGPIAYGSWRSNAISWKKVRKTQYKP